jgi:hypothetical protein
MVEENVWAPGDAAYLIVALNEPATHILYSVLTGAKYEEVAAVLEDCYRDHCLAE